MPDSSTCPTGRPSTTELLVLVCVRALAALAAGVELLGCLLRPFGAAGAKLELPMAAMGADAAAIAGATAAATALGFVGSRSRGGLQVFHGKTCNLEKAARADDNLGIQENADSDQPCAGVLGVGGGGGE